MNLSEKGSSVVLGQKRTVEELDPAERARILRKVDWRILPLVSLFYLLSFLDRANVGNAKVAGMSTDLKLTGLKYNIAVAVLFPTYGLAEVPSNIALKLFRPSRWIPTIMVVWGLVMTLMCLVNSYQSLVIARVCLGLAEGGLLPGVNYYICNWYPRSQRSKRLAIFFSAVTLSGAFGGLLAYCIENMNGIGGLRGWQWIFCLEGLATVVVACVAFFVMQDYPETATFLTEPERTYVLNMLKQDDNNLATHYSIQFVLQAMKDYKIYIQVIIAVGFAVPGYAIAIFTPTIINELGYSSTHAQLLTVPPFVVACCGTLIVGIYSDKHGLRGPYIVGCSSVALIGYIVLYCSIRPGPSYVGVFLVALGVYPSIPVFLAWVGSNAGGDLKRGVALAIVIGLGSLGGICASFTYIDPPRFHTGHGTIMGFLSLAMLSSLFSMWNFHRLNKKKEARCQAEGITEERSDEFKNMGDASPLFRYII